MSPRRFAHAVGLPRRTRITIGVLALIALAFLGWLAGRAWLGLSGGPATPGTSSPVSMGEPAAGGPLSPEDRRRWRAERPKRILAQPMISATLPPAELRQQLGAALRAELHNPNNAVPAAQANQLADQIADELAARLANDADTDMNFADRQRSTWRPAEDDPRDPKRLGPHTRSLRQPLRRQDP